MRDVNERPTEDFTRWLYDDRCDQFSTEFPPWASRLKIVVEKHLVGTQPFDSAFEARVVDKTPRLSAEITRHPKPDIVKNLGNAIHLKFLEPTFLRPVVDKVCMIDGKKTCLERRGSHR